MNAAVFETPLENETAYQQPPDQKVKQFEAALRLASFLAKPAAFVSEENCALGAFDARTVQALARYKAFRDPLNRELARSLKVDVDAVSDELISRLANSPELRLATVILTAPLNGAQNIALMLAASILSQRLRGLMLKADRTAMQEALGIVGFDLAIQEAPLLYPLLTNLDRVPADARLFQPGVPLAERQQLAIGLGFQAIGKFLDAVDPGLAGMYGLRLSPNLNYAERRHAVGDFQDVHCNQFIRLIRRRQKSWWDIIG